MGREVVKSFKRSLNNSEGAGFEKPSMISSAKYAARGASGPEAPAL